MSWIKDISLIIFYIIAMALIVMDSSAIVVGTVTIVMVGIMVYSSGWENALIGVGYILFCVAILISTEYFFGQTGKEYLAIFLVIAVCAILYIRKKKGLEMWW